MRNFRTLQVWQTGIEIIKATYSLTKNLPSEERFGFVSQMNRAAVSIPSNIAEGSSRSTQKDFRRFLEIALGSAFELETQLIAIQEIKLITDEQAADLVKLIDEEQKMLISFMKKVSE